MAGWQDGRFTDFTYGYIDKIDDTELSASALKNCRNVISKQVGKISARAGQVKLNSTELGTDAPIQGMKAFYSNGTKYLIVAAGGTVYYCNPPVGEMTQIKTGLNATAPIFFVTVVVDGVNQIIGFNGVDTPFKWDGTTVADLNDYRIVTREKPTSSDYTTYTLAHKPVRAADKTFVFSNNNLVDAADYTLDLTNGTVTFNNARVNTVSDRLSAEAATVTYPLNGRIESVHPYMVGCTVTVYDKNGIVLKVLTDETESDGWKADYGAGVVYAPTTINDNPLYTYMPITTTYQWVDEIRVDYQYSNGLISSQYQYPVTHKGRIFAMGNDERIYWSDITENGSEYECWPPINNWPVCVGSGQKDGCLISMMGELFIFMDRSIHRFRGNDLTDYRLEVVEPSIGCAGPRAARLENDKIYFISEQGLYVFNGVTATNMTRDRIPLLWNRINKAALHQSAVYSWQGLILFALPLDDSPVNNFVIACDPSVPSLWPWDGMNIAMWEEISTTSGTKLYAGSSLNGFVLQQDTGTDDAGVNINAFFELPTIDVGAAERLKKARYIYVEYGVDQAIFGSVHVAINNGEYQEIEARNADDNMRKFALRPTIRGKWRYLNIKIQHNAADSFDVRSVLLPFKVKEKPKVKGAV